MFEFLSPLLGGLFSGGASVASSAMAAQQSGQNTAATIAANERSQREAEAFNAQQADINRQFQSGQVQQQQGFQTQMSNTAYQRASADMKAAGLNPMMMFGSGSAASSPSGSAGSGSSASVSPQKYDYSGVKSPFEGIGDAVKNALGTAVQLRTANATVDNLVEQNAKIKAETATERERPALTRTQEFATEKSGQKSAADIERIYTAMPIVINEAQTAKNQMDFDANVRKRLDQAGFAAGRIDDILAPLKGIIGTGAGAARSFNQIWKDRVDRGY